jgi:ABC-type enterobactin transport system permease subunit
VLAALSGNGSGAADFVVLDLRLARALCAVAIGAALGALLAVGRGAVGYRLIPVGIGVNAMLFAVNSYLLVTPKLEDALIAQIWLVGSLNGRSWAQLWPVLVVLGICLPLLMAAARPLGLLEMGDDAARALGVRTNRTRIVVVVLAVALAPPRRPPRVRSRSSRWPPRNWPSGRPARSAWLCCPAR